MEHILRSNEVLKSSLCDEIKDNLLDGTMDTKDWIDKQKGKGYLIAHVSMSGDLAHSSHIQYINTIIAKIRKEIPNQPFKLVVGIEADWATIRRKLKENVYSEEERKYLFNNLKGVDHCHITFEALDEQTNDRRPAGIVKYLNPDIFCSHFEHIQDDEDMVRQNCIDAGIPHTVVIKDGDQEKYLGEENMRDKFNRSTTNTIRQIFQMYSENPKYNTFVSSNNQ